MQTIHKAMAYITRGTELLVFEHADFPEAGIQVPAGTIEPGESPADAALREAREETGLAPLTLASSLGETVREMNDYGKNEIHHRHVFHLIAPPDTPDAWIHAETNPSDGSNSVYQFRFYWVELRARLPDLIADHGKLIPELVANLRAMGTLWD